MDTQAYPLGSLPAHMKIARQRVSATKSGNGLQKTLQTISIWRWLLFILFFYFSVVLVVIREKSPQLWDFPRQPARQRDSNRGCNGLSFSEWKLHLFCDLHKTIHRFFQTGCRSPFAGLSRSPALLSAIFGKHSWVLEVPPAVNALVHNLVDFPGFPIASARQKHGSRLPYGAAWSRPCSRCTYQDTPVSSRLWCPPA